MLIYKVVMDETLPKTNSLTIGCEKQDFVKEHEGKQWGWRASSLNHTRASCASSLTTHRCLEDQV
jgi:hypothetical protein